MRLSINARDRELALLTLELADRQCEQARKALESLRLEPMAVMARQGHVGKLRRELKDAKRHTYEWSFDDRVTLAAAFYAYKAELVKLASKEGKLLVATSATDELITDVTDFIARLSGQDTLFTETEHASAAADVDDVEPAPLTPALESFIDGSRPEAVSEKRILRTLELLATELDHGAPRITEQGFTGLAREVLRLVSRVRPELDATRDGAWLLEEVRYDDTNALVLASWIHRQLETARQASLPLDPPRKAPLSTEAINEIRMSLGKDPLPVPPAMEQEVERQIVAENGHRNPLEVACRHCKAAVDAPCTTSAGKIVARRAHAERLRDVGMFESRKRLEIADRLYVDAVLTRIFGRSDKHLREAATRHGTIDLAARWVQTAKANGGAHAVG